MAKSASEELSLQRNCTYLRCPGLSLVLAKLETRDDLGLWGSFGPQSCSASLVLHLDFAAGSLAARLCLVYIFRHSLCIFFILELKIKYKANARLPYPMLTSSDIPTAYFKEAM